MSDQNDDQNTAKNADENAAENEAVNDTENDTKNVDQNPKENADQNPEKNDEQNPDENTEHNPEENAEQNPAGQPTADPNASASSGSNQPVSPFQYQSYFNLAMLLKIQSRIENLQRLMLSSNYTDTSEMFLEVREQRQLLQSCQLHLMELINGAVNLMERYTGDMNAQRAMMILLKLNLTFIGFNSILNNIELNVTIWDYVSVSKVMSFILDIKEFTHYIESNFIRQDSLGINERLV